jgi:glycosyltransferase involved in cell wall biosynthesis
VTVVVPVRNRPVLLRRALLSLAAQRHDRFVVVVVDDGSDEPVDDVVASCGLRDVVVLSGPPRGAGWARNAGAAAAQTRWLTFLDSDDEADPAWLSNMEDLGETTGADMVFCGAHRIRPSARPPVRMMRPLADEYDTPTLFLAGAFMLRTDLFRAVGGYDASLPAAQHTDLGLRLMDHLDGRDGTTAWTDEPLVTFHVSDAGNIRSDSEALARAARAMLDKHGSSMSAPTRANYHAVAGVNAVRSGEPSHVARAEFWAAVRTEPGRPVHWSRWLLSVVPAIARRRWLRDSDIAAST